MDTGVAMDTAAAMDIAALIQELTTVMMVVMVIAAAATNIAELMEYPYPALTECPEQLMECPEQLMGHLTTIIIPMDTEFMATNHD